MLFGYPALSYGTTHNHLETKVKYSTGDIVVKHKSILKILLEFTTMSLKIGPPRCGARLRAQDMRETGTYK